MSDDSIRELTAEIRAFAQERDWEQFHDPKSLLLALTGELGELSELFQWIPADEAAKHFAEPHRKARAAEEVADVLTYLLRLADVLDIDVAEATRAKMESSRERFPRVEFNGKAPEKP